METLRNISSKISKPIDLAEAVFNHFKVEDNIELPPLDVLEELFDCLFYTSLHSEEGQLIKLVVTFFSPTSVPVMRSPKLKSTFRWLYSPFENPINLEVNSLTKLGKAADPWSSSIAISFDKDNKLWIKGMIDQAIHLQSYLNLEDNSRPDQPGLFQVSITGIGSLAVMTDLELIATLKQDVLIKKQLNVFREGPVAEIIAKLATISNKNAKSYLLTTANEKDLDLDFNFAYGQLIFSNTISRLLNKIRSYGHGGAVLITDSIKENNLDIKYKLSYNRLSTTIVKYKVNRTNKNIETQDWDDTTPESEKNRELKRESELIAKELKGAIRFVASLSRVDGLVLINNSFEVNGFGVVIRDLAFPKHIHFSSTLKATNLSLTTKSVENYGTRHRTMFAYCDKYPGSLGFVISQDGDIRAITKVGKKLVVWENILTQKNIKSKPIKGPRRNE